MSEFDDLVAVFGRIDDAVVQDPDLLPKVAAMLPPYRHAGVSGWYQALQDWQRAQDVQLVADRDFGAALMNLQEETAAVAPDEEDYEAWATRHWLNGRRMLAAATIGRIQGYLDLDLPDGADLHAVVSGIAHDSSGPKQLYDQLRRSALYPNIGAWSMMMADIHSRSLVKEEFVNSGAIPPIDSDPGSFRVVQSSSGESVALRTHYHAADLTLDKAMRCLDPAGWYRYQPPWCQMNDLDPALTLPPQTKRYEEVISADCAIGNQLKAVLNFQLQPLPDGGGILEYRIPEDRQNQVVSIDEGSLEVRPARSGVGGIHFVTTKRVQFAALSGMPAMPAAFLGFLVWVLGWDTQAERFLYFMARDNPPSLVPTGQGATTPQGPVLPQDWASSGITTLLDLSLAQLQTYLRGCIAPMRSSMERAASGNYGIADYLSDLTRLSDEVTKNTTALATMGAQMCRSLTGPSGPGAGGGGTPPAAQSGGPRTKTPQSAATRKPPARRPGKTSTKDSGRTGVAKSAKKTGKSTKKR